MTREEIEESVPMEKIKKYFPLFVEYFFKGYIGKNSPTGPIIDELLNNPLAECRHEITGYSKNVSRVFTLKKTLKDLLDNFEMGMDITLYATSPIRMQK